MNCELHLTQFSVFGSPGFMYTKKVFEFVPIEKPSCWSSFLDVQFLAIVLVFAMFLLLISFYFLIFLEVALCFVF